jgi:hypothetical protein
MSSLAGVTFITVVRIVQSGEYGVQQITSRVRDVRGGRYKIHSFA